MNKTGICICKREPMGTQGLEGFVRGECYYFEQCDADKNGRPYYRVFHDTTYYETCGTLIFKQHFRKEDEPMRDTKIHEGDRVRHAVFGEGNVIHQDVIFDISLTGKVQTVKFDRSGRNVECMISNLKKIGG